MANTTLKTDALKLNVKWNACADALFLMSHIKRKSPDTISKFTKKWLNQIDANPEIKKTFRRVSGDVRYLGLFQACDQGFDTVIKNLELETFRVPSVSSIKVSNIYMFRDPGPIEDVNFDEEFAKIIKQSALDEKEKVRETLIFLKNNSFVEDWNQANKSNSIDKVSRRLEEWSKNLEVQNFLLDARALLCPLKVDCLGRRDVWISNLISLDANNKKVEKTNKEKLLLPSFTSKVLIPNISYAYKSNVKVPQKADFKNNKSELKPAQRKALKKYYERYPYGRSIDPVVQEGLKVWLRYRAGEIRRYQVLQSFISRKRGGPIEAWLFLELESIMSDGRAPSFVDVENFLKRFESTGFDLREKELRKKVEDIMGLAGFNFKNQKGKVVVTYNYRDDIDLKTGDIIVSVDGKPVAGMATGEVSQMIVGPPKTIRKFKILRDGREKEIPVELMSYDLFRKKYHKKILVKTMEKHDEKYRDPEDRSFFKRMFRKAFFNFFYWFDSIRE